MLSCAFIIVDSKKLKTFVSRKKNALDHSSGPLFLTNLLSPILLAGNVQGSTLLGIVILILLILSFFLSGAEVAFFSLSFKDINTLKTKQDAAWKRIVNLLE